MPRIPSFELPQVQAQGLQGGIQGMTRSTSAEALGYVGQGAQIAVAEYQKNKEYVQSIQYHDAMNKVLAADAELTSQAQALKGHDYIKVGPNKFNDDRQKRIDEITKDLPEVVKTQVLQNADRAKVAFNNNLDNHLRAQTEFLNKTNALTSIEAANTYAASHPYDQAGIDARLGLAMAAKDSTLAGLSPEAKTQELNSLRANVLLNQLGGIMSSDPNAAKTFYDKNAEVMSASVEFPKVKARFDASQLANQVQAKANEIEALGLPLDKQTEKARELMAGNPEGMKALENELKDRFSVKQTAQATQARETTGALWDMRFPTIPGSKPKSMSTIMQSKEWASLRGDQRNELIAQWEIYTKRNDNDPSVLVARYATYQKILDNPESLLKMSDQEIASYTSALGPQLSMSLMDAKRKVANNLDSLKAYTLNDIPFKDIVAEYGFKTKGTLSKTESAKIGDIRSTVMNAIQAEQDQTKKIVSPERKEEILRNQLRKVVVNQPGWWFGIADSSTQKFAYEVKDWNELDATPNEKAQAIYLLDSNRVPITVENVEAMVDQIRQKKAAEK